MKWPCPTHALVKKTIHAHQPNGQGVSLEHRAPAEGAAPRWSGDAETASKLTNKERNSEDVFSRNTRPAARLSLRKPQPKFPSKTLFMAGSKEGRKGEEADEGPTTGYRILSFKKKVERRRRRKKVVVQKKEKKSSSEEKKKSSGWSREWVRKKPTIVNKR